MNDQPIGQPKKHTEKHQGHTEPVVGSGPTAFDPVCGMTVALETDTQTKSFGGKSFDVCSVKCHRKFTADPWYYASSRAAGHRMVPPANVKYTCPIHPENIRDAPGACPIRGLALEPAEAGLLVSSIRQGDKPNQKRDTPQQVDSRKEHQNAN